MHNFFSLARHPFLLALSLVLITACSHDQHSNNKPSPYAGQESRDIKALTAEEVDGYLNGLGMGLSKVAELNHYPGPKHVLELADQLALTDQQLEQTQNLFKQMENRAMEAGRTYIAYERELNRLFETGTITSSTADSLLIEIGKVKGRLRAIHVSSHIEMKNILTPEQIKKYDQLRGYDGGTSHHRQHDHS